MVGPMVDDGLVVSIVGIDWFGLIFCQRAKNFGFQARQYKNIFFLKYAHFYFDLDV